MHVKSKRKLKLSQPLPREKKSLLIYTLLALVLAIGLVVDDFGMGYSSLHSLHRFPVQTFKIDRSLVTALGDNFKLVRAIVAMGEALGGASH